MTNRKKILIIVLMIGLLTLSCFIGYFWGFKRGFLAAGISSSIFEFANAQEHIDAQMENADCEGVKKALFDFLVLIEKYKNVEGSLVSGTVYYGDKMLMHTRLARIERVLNNEQDAREHMKLALEACAQRGWKECSEGKIIQFSKRLEEKHPIACLSKFEK